jgi:hypothetical protein
VAAPLKTDGDFTAQPPEAWGNEIVAEPVTRSWAEEVPVPAPVSGTTAQPVPYSASDDWATQVSVTGHKVAEQKLAYCNLEMRHIINHIIKCC